MRAPLAKRPQRPFPLRALPLLLHRATCGACAALPRARCLAHRYKFLAMHVVAAGLFVGGLVLHRDSQQVGRAGQGGQGGRVAPGPPCAPKKQG